jgi:hypothetical protein
MQYAHIIFRNLYYLHIHSYSTLLVFKKLLNTSYRQFTLALLRILLYALGKYNETKETKTISSQINAYFEWILFPSSHLSVFGPQSV